MPLEQAQAVVAKIVNSPPVQRSPSCQEPAPQRRQTCPTRGVRGWGGQSQERRRQWRGREGGQGGLGKQTPPPEDGRISKRQQRAGKRRSRMRRKRKNGKEGDRDGDTPRGAPVEVIRVGGGMPPPEENANLPDFKPEHAHQLLSEVYGDFTHHNNGLHLDGGVADDAIWQRLWRRLAAQSAIWHATPSGAVGRRFTAILAAEWWGILGRIWNSKRPLVFAQYRKDKR